MTLCHLTIHGLTLRLARLSSSNSNSDRLSTQIIWLLTLIVRVIFFMIRRILTVIFVVIIFGRWGLDYL